MPSSSWLLVCPLAAGTEVHATWHTERSRIFLIVLTDLALDVIRIHLLLR